MVGIGGVSGLNLHGVPSLIVTAIGATAVVTIDRSVAARA
jgi:hypothetical protein